MHLNLQHGFQFGEQSLPHNKHNAGSSKTTPQSGQFCLIYLIVAPTYPKTFNGYTKIVDKLDIITNIADKSNTILMHVNNQPL